MQPRRHAIQDVIQIAFQSAFKRGYRYIIDARGPPDWRVPSATHGVPVVWKYKMTGLSLSAPPGQGGVGRPAEDLMIQA